MLHGEAKVGVNSQGGPRGTTKFESQNWLMPMATRKVGRGTLELRGMFSAEPLTYSGAGSPQLFQSGEVYKGRSIIDAQHPHDLLMELSARYTLPVGERGSWFAYVGYPGEPALGPVAFMHRASAAENPSAPLAHHLQDSTHVSFGVFTTGFTYRRLKVEGSVFNGREPDERRYDFEAGRWSSRSVRVSVAPNRNWVAQYSYGFLKNPELLHEGDTHRQSASVRYNRPRARGNWATSLIWGRNREAHDGHTYRLNSYTLESTLNFLDRNYLYTRAELVDKKDILRPADLRELGFSEHAHPQFRVGAYTSGYVRDIYAVGKYSVGLGGDTTFYFAGHGTAQGSRFYLIPHDLGYAGERAQVTEEGLRQMLRHSISDEELEAAFEGLHSGRTVLVIDACNSGQALEAEEKRRGPMNSKGLAQLAYEKGMYVLTASLSLQVANEEPVLGHGYLTYVLVNEGLRSDAADKEPADGAVLLREWFDYAEGRVPRLHEERMRGKTPG